MQYRRLGWMPSSCAILRDQCLASGHTVSHYHFLLLLLSKRQAEEQPLYQTRDTSQEPMPSANLRRKDAEERVEMGQVECSSSSAFLFCSCLCSIMWVNDRTLLSVQIKRWRDDAGWMGSPSHLFIPHHAQPSFGLKMQTLHWDEGPQNHFPMFTRVTLPLLFFPFVTKFNLYNCTPPSFHL